MHYGIMLTKFLELETIQLMQRIMQRRLYECLLKSDYQGKFSQIKAAILHVKYCPEQKYKLIYVKDLRICLCYSQMDGFV